MNRDELMQEARKQGARVDFLAYRGPGRTEGNADREVANALDYLVSCGYYDADGGEIDSPTGHFARIDRWIVLTDTQGFVTVEEHANPDYARTHFDALEREYYGWASGDDE